VGEQSGMEGSGAGRGRHRVAGTAEGSELPLKLGHLFALGQLAALQDGENGLFLLLAYDRAGDRNHDSS
jgi:hypothetical protein